MREAEMASTEWTVDTAPAAQSERWAAWVSARRSLETPMLALVLAGGVFFARQPGELLAGVQMGVVGFLLAAAFFLWERRGFRRLVGRYEAELARLRGRTGSD